MESYKQIIDSLGNQLINACKQKTLRDEAYQLAEDALMRGAAVNYSNSRAIYFAVKNYNFDLVKLLIRYGALDSDKTEEKKSKTLNVLDSRQSKEDRDNNNSFAQKAAGLDNFLTQNPPVSADKNGEKSFFSSREYASDSAISTNNNQVSLHANSATRQCTSDSATEDNLTACDASYADCAVNHTNNPVNNANNPEYHANAEQLGGQPKQAEGQSADEVSLQLLAMPAGEVSRKFLASMCERGGFTKQREEAFFQLIDTAIARTGFDEIYLAPYINMTLIAGRVDKLTKALNRYKLSVKRAMNHVKIMAIFEVIELAREESLNLINEYLDWHEEAIDIAVAKGRFRVAEYIFFKNRDIAPSRGSIVKAIMAGNVEMLELLCLYGINLTDEVYVKAAVDAFATTSAPLQFLADTGATWVGFNGRSLYENALAIGDKKLIAFVKTLNVIQG